MPTGDVITALHESSLGPENHCWELRNFLDFFLTPGIEVFIEIFQFRLLSFEFGNGTNNPGSLKKALNRTILKPGNNSPGRS
jgi:hypothetical protein